VSTVVYFADDNVRTLPIGRIDGNCEDLDKDFVLTDCGNRPLLCFDGPVRLDDDCPVGLWDFEVGHIESFLNLVRVEMYRAVGTVLSEIV